MSPTTGSVLLVTPRWTRDGGVAAHVQASAEALARQGVQVAVLAAQVDFDQAIEGVALYESGALAQEGAGLRERLGEAFALATDVVHVHQLDDPALVRALREKAPVAISVHAYSACTSGVYYFQPGVECTRGHGPGCVPNLLRCAHTRYPKTLPVKYRNATRARAALRGADLAVCYSSAVDRHLANNGIEPRAIVPLIPTTAPREGSGHETRRRVVFAGRMVRTKGVGVLIRAAALVDAEFVLCGEGRELERMRALAHELGVSERVRFAGWLDAEQLAWELAEASIVVLPSLWPEPFGLVGIEAFASGRPVVASATGGVRDWLSDGVDGLTVPPGDAGRLARALEDLLADPERQRRMGEAGRRSVAERFSPERHVGALLDCYASLHGAQARPGRAAA
jgi:glycosyltransferase involved in cell wall biosynthesis